MSRVLSGDSDGAGAARDRGDLGWRGSRAVVGEVGAERVVNLAGDVALETAEDVAFGLAFSGPSLCVGAGALAVAQSANGDQVQRPVGLAGRRRS